MRQVVGAFFNKALERGVGRSGVGRAARALAACAIGASGASAQEVVVQNDTLVNGAGANLCFCFAGGEEAAVWLNSPCDGNIVAIQIFWTSPTGGSQPALEDAIRIYEGGSFPTPGPLIDEFLGPVLADGGLNEFREADTDLMIPISVPVMAGEDFVVSLRFFNDNAGDTTAPTIVSDDSGCQTGKNAVKVNGLFWADACLLGVSGDWVIRAVIDCAGGVTTGACCTADGGCDDDVLLADCVSAGGFWNGAGSTCAQVSCVGACRAPNGDCVSDVTKDICDAFMGTWQGPGTTDCGPCPADLDNDGDADPDDIAAFVQLFIDTNPINADVDMDGDEDPDDIAAFVTAFIAGCP